MSGRTARAVLVAWAAAALGMALWLSAGDALAQGRRGKAPPPPPRDEAKAAEEEEERASSLRTEPVVSPPADPLLVSPEIRQRIGSDWDGRPPSPEGSLSHTRWFPYYEEQRGDYRLRLLPPFFVEQTRGRRDPSQQLYGVPATPDTSGLYGLLYYRRRSLQLDMDVVFPALWRVRDGESHTLVAGPVVHREAPGENDNWLAPLVFQGSRPDGGYFHSPLLLTTSHWGDKGAFTLVGPYFRSRTDRNVDAGIVPFYFHGDTGSVDGNRRAYTLIPPLLYYHQERELDSSTLTVLGPIIQRSDPKRDIFDIGPLFFHISGKPETGGVSESHTTLFPFFHYGHDPDQKLFILPGYYRRVTSQTDTMLTPLWSSAKTRGGATSLTAIGPVLPLWWDYRDRDLGAHAWALAPLFYSSQSPAGRDWLTPVLGRFESYGQSRTWWVFPTLTLSADTKGWEDDLHPLVYVGRHDDSTHTVVAPFFWDFASPRSRTTIGFPLYWRFADGEDDSVTQVAANTLYMQKRVPGGHDWQFHLLPLFSYGESPSGYFWNVLFGLAGYTRDGATAKVRALWIPIDVSGSPPASKTASSN